MKKCTGELSYTSHETGISLWNHPAVLKPEVKNVTQQVELLNISINTIEPRYEKLLTGEAISKIWMPKVKVGGKVYFSILIHRLK